MLHAASLGDIKQPIPCKPTPPKLPMTEFEKRQARMIKNREAATQSRKRRKVSSHPHALFPVSTSLSHLDFCFPSRPLFPVATSLSRLDFSFLSS